MTISISIYSSEKWNGLKSPKIYDDDDDVDDLIPKTDYGNTKASHLNRTLGQFYSKDLYPYNF
jgi:hypothetical protein